MARYVLDHNYAKDHMDFCRVVESDRDEMDVREILTAIQFYFEETVDEHEDPDLDDVLELLSKHFGFKIRDKNENADMIEECVFGAYSFEYEGVDYEYIDLYSTREYFCGNGNPEKLYAKWLKPDIMDDIKKLKPEE